MQQRNFYMPYVHKLMLPSMAAFVVLLCLLFPAERVLADDTPITDDPDALIVTANKAYIDIYSGPGRGYPVFHVLEKNEPVILRKIRTDWIKVQTKRGKEGWVRRDDMQYMLGPDDLPPSFTDELRSDAVVGYFEFGAAYGDFGGADTMAFSLGYRFTRNLTAELRYAQNTGRVSNSEIISVGLLHQPFPEWRISPFFGIGAGTITIDPNATLVATEDRIDSVLQASIGTYVYLSRRFFIRAEYTNHYMLTTRESNEEVNGWKLGFNVFF